jgi:hypothetical protein
MAPRALLCNVREAMHTSVRDSINYSGQEIIGADVHVSLRRKGPDPATCSRAMSAQVLAQHDCRSFAERTCLPTSGVSTVSEEHAGQFICSAGCHYASVDGR